MQHKIFKTSFAAVYPFYVQKAERKNRTQAEVDKIICWLTGYTPAALKKQIKNEVDFTTFFAEAPKLNPLVKQIQGVVCGVRVEDVKDPLMRKIRYLDKLIDELAKGKAIENILRQSSKEKNVEKSEIKAKTKAKAKKKTGTKKTKTKKAVK